MPDLKWGNTYYQELKIYILNVILSGTPPPHKSQFTYPCGENQFILPRNVLLFAQNPLKYFIQLLYMGGSHKVIKFQISLVHKMVL